MEKYNRLSVVVFCMVIGGFILSYMKYLASVGAILALVGFILGIVSYTQIRKTKEKGMGLLITLLVIFILVVISMVLLYLPIFKS